MAQELLTLLSIIVNGPKAKAGLDFDTMERLDGDGRVSWVGAHPPDGVLSTLFSNISAGVPHEDFVSAFPHHQLLGDPQVPQILERLLAQAHDMFAPNAPGPACCRVNKKPATLHPAEHPNVSYYLALPFTTLATTP